MGRDIAVGQSASFSKTITEWDVYTFAGLSGDLNPAHINEEYAKTTRFGGRIAHGMLSAGLISAVIGMQLPGPGTIYMGQTLKFLSPCASATPSPPASRSCPSTRSNTVRCWRRPVSTRTAPF